VATILTFSPHFSPLGDPRRTPPPADTHAEVIVFPRTDVRALARVTGSGDTGSDHAIEGLEEKDPS
jgi:hypothetical protein